MLAKDLKDGQLFRVYNEKKTFYNENGFCYDTDSDNQYNIFDPDTRVFLVTKKVVTQTTFEQEGVPLSSLMSGDKFSNKFGVYIVLNKTSETMKCYHTKHDFIVNMISSELVVPVID